MPKTIIHDNVLILRGGYTECSTAYREAIDHLALIEAGLNDRGIPRSDWQYHAEWNHGHDKIVALHAEGHLGKFTKEEQSPFIKAIIDANGGSPA